MISSINLNLPNELHDQEFRHEFFITKTQDEVAAQIRNFRECRGLTQAQLAKFCDMKQSAISRLEDSDYSGWSFKTLSRIAKALDLRFEIIFTCMKDVLLNFEFDGKASMERPSQRFLELPEPTIPGCFRGSKIFELKGNGVKTEMPLIGLR